VVTETHNGTEFEH